MAKASAPILSTGDLADKAASYLRHILDQGLSSPTQEIHMEAIRQFSDFLASQGLPTNVSAIRQEHVEAFVVHLGRRRRPGTVRLRFRGLRQFFGWLASQNIILESPTRRMLVSAPDPVPAVVSDEDLDTLLATCMGDSFQESRDAAIIQVFVDTGVTRAEIADLRVVSEEDGSSDLDLAGRLLRVRQLRDDSRFVPFSQETELALARYLRRRAEHRSTSLPWLWIGERGNLSANGIRVVVRRRGYEADLGSIHPRQLRNTFARRLLLEGRSEGDLMLLAGWRSTRMVRRLRDT